jgi:hypothetical protein
MSNSTTSTSKQKFPLGQIVATPAALDALNASGDSAHHFLTRHATGDWGDLCEGDRQANDADMIHGGRLLSAYVLRDGTKLWVITEADRSATTLLLPSDY